MRMQVRSLALLSGLRMQHCRELWCRSQTWLGSGIAVALVQAGGYSSDWTASLGTSTYHGCSPKKAKKKKMGKDGPEKHLNRKVCLTSFGHDVWLRKKQPHWTTGI